MVKRLFHNILCITLAMTIVMSFAGCSQSSSGASAETEKPSETSATEAIVKSEKEEPAEDDSLANVDFSSSKWLDDFLEENLTAQGYSFTDSSAFSVSSGDDVKAMIDRVYASDKSVADIRNAFLGNGFQITGEEDNTDYSLSLEKDIAYGSATITNYYSEFYTVIDQHLTLNKDSAMSLREQLNKVFPEDKLEELVSVTSFTDGENTGTYVRYFYDDLVDYYYLGTPLFSKAYTYSGTLDEFKAELAKLEDVSEHSAYDDDGLTAFFSIDGAVVSVAYFTGNDKVNRVSIAVQLPE